MKNNSLSYAEQTKQLGALNPKKEPLKPKQPNIFKPQLRGSEKYSEIILRNRLQPISPPKEDQLEEEEEIEDDTNESAPKPKATPKQLKGKKIKIKTNQVLVTMIT